MQLIRGGGVALAARLDCRLRFGYTSAISREASSIRRTRTVRAAFENNARVQNKTRSPRRYERVFRRGRGLLWQSEREGSDAVVAACKTSTSAPCCSHRRGASSRTVTAAVTVRDHVDNRCCIHHIRFAVILIYNDPPLFQRGDPGAAHRSDFAESLSQRSSWFRVNHTNDLCPGKN